MGLQDSNKIILGSAYKLDNNSRANFILERITDNPETSVKPNYYSKDLIIFPNPAKENLYFGKETTFEITDLQGKILLKSTNPVQSVNISELEAGVYFVRVGNCVRKFVKE